LRRYKLTAGRKPDFHVSARVAATTSTMGNYVCTPVPNDESRTSPFTDYLAMDIERVIDAAAAASIRRASETPVISDSDKEFKLPQGCIAALFLTIRR